MYGLLFYSLKLIEYPNGTLIKKYMLYLQIKIHIPTLIVNMLLNKR